MSMLKIAVLQYPIRWKDKHANFSVINEMMDGKEADLIVLPEMFQTGFCIDDPEQAEELHKETLRYMANLGKHHNAGVVGSFMEKEQDHLYNTMVLVEEGEVKGTYRKRHLFSYGREDHYISEGDRHEDFNFRGFKIRPIICYDLRFPYVCYNHTDYDMLVCCANWPSARIQHWDALLAARAIENQAYVVACNRVGEQPAKEDNVIYYPGHSSIYHPNGSVLAKSHKQEVLEIELSKEVIEQTRASLPFLKDRKV